jgi:hypothetical protein
MTVVFPEVGAERDERVVALFEPIVDLRHGAAAAYDVVWAGAARYEARRLAALGAIAQLSATLRAHSLFFIEAAPDAVDDPRADAEEHAIAAASLVLSISGDAEAAVRHYARLGFQIALDAASVERVALSALFCCGYLEIDLQAKPSSLPSIAAVSRNLGAVLIAGGVATWEDAEMLVRHGVEWAHGPLFGAPSPRPQPLEPSVSRRIVRLFGS